MNIVIKIPKEEEEEFLQFVCEVGGYDREFYDPSDGNIKKHSDTMTEREFLNLSLQRNAMNDFVRWQQRQIETTTNITVE